jgi:blocked-early-in-transport protein 1
MLGDLEENFEKAGAKLKNTFGRMMIMAERSGISWKVWLGLFAFIFIMFFYVWWM